MCLGRVVVFYAADGAWGNPETTGGLTSYTPFGFAGGYTDPTGLVYLIGRYYDPGTGQFLNIDPKVETTAQPYQYADDNPVNQSDPTGLMVCVSQGPCGSAQYLSSLCPPSPSPTIPITFDFGNAFVTAGGVTLTLSGSITLSGAQS